MNRINANVTEFAPRSTVSGHASPNCACWICQTNLSARAAFCHDCGTIQAVRNVDHFTRLGLETRFDVDRDQLEQRYTALARIYHAERFGSKGPRQKQLASDHLVAVEEAYADLRCPVRRAQYLLSLMDAPAEIEVQSDGESAVLREELTSAADAPAIDRVAFKASHGVEIAIRELSAAFRQQSYAEAVVVLARLAEFEDIAASARARRSAI